MTKICNTCEKEVEDGANFCPYCKGRSFRPKYEMTSPKGDLVHRIFYWTYPEGAVLSKSKLGGIVIFVYLFTLLAALANPIWSAFIISLIFALIIFLVGFLVHKILPKPHLDKIKHNDYGLIHDLKHLFFYWQDKNGGYIISKTKILSFIVFLLMFAFGLSIMSANVIFGAIFCGFIFEVPAFMIGFGIHKLTFNDTSKHIIPEKTKKPEKIKRQVRKSLKTPQIIPEYVDYQMQLDELNSKFIQKDKFVRKIIEKRFEPPQLTYTRFITGVDKSKELFNKNLNSALTMINLADEYTPRIAGEIESKIDILKSIIKKLDDLGNELVLNEDISIEEEVDDLVEDMDNLINSVKDY